MHLPTRLANRRIAVAAMAGVAALTPVVAVAANPFAASPVAAATRAAGCPTSGLVVWLDTTANGTAGSIYYDLKITNLSGHTCTFAGYPGVSAVNLAGRQLGSAASRNRAHAPARVRLANDATATVVLRIVEAGNFSPSACHPVIAAGLRVYPPNRTASKVVPFPFMACARVGPGYLSVEAIQG